MSDIQDGSDWLNENVDQKPSLIEKERIKFEDATNPIVDKAKGRKDLFDNFSKMKNRLNDPNDSISLLSSDDKKKLKNAADELQKWLEDNPNASKEEIDAQKKKYEDIVNPLLQKAQTRADLTDLAKNLKDRVNDENDALNKLNSKEKKIILDAIKETEDFLKKKILMLLMMN